MRDWLTALFGRKWDDAVAHEVVHPEVRGKKFKNVMDSRLRPIRVRIAHSVLDESEPGLPSALEQNPLLASANPVLRASDDEERIRGSLSDRPRNPPRLETRAY
jgi:hypothetical protein